MQKQNTEEQQQEKKRCSIVITAYNVEKTIALAVASALQQTAPCEVIVVADKPTDNTLDELKQFGDEIMVVENEKNVGAGLSRRIGIEHATGEYVLLLDGDDYLDKDFIRQLLVMADMTDADIVSGGVRILNEDGSWDATSYGTCLTEGREKVTKFWGERIVFMNNKIIRRSLYDKVPYCDRRYIEDTPVIIPIMFYANKVAYVDNIGYTYVMRKGSLTHTADKLKDVIYKGLCWLDLVDFFNEHDKGMFDAMPIKQYLSNIIGTLNTMEITKEAIAPYKEQWDEFMLRLMNAIAITDVKVLDAKKGGNVEQQVKK